MDIRVGVFVMLAAILAGCSSPASPSGTVGAPSSSRDLTSFAISQPSATGVISGTAVAVTVPFGTAVTALAATFQTTGAAVKVRGVVQTSGVTVNDFSQAVVYTVCAANGDTKDYQVHVSVAASSDKALTSFQFPEQGTGAALTGTEGSLTVPYGTDLTHLVAAFATSGTAVKIGAITQVSGVTVNDFSHPVVYTVFAADGSSQDYTITVSAASGADKQLLTFAFGRTAGVIDGNTVNIQAPVGADLKHLSPQIDYIGVKALVGSVEQSKNGTDNNFSGPVIYTVVAQDGSAVNYTVNVTQGAGVLSTLAGSLTTLQFMFPWGVAVDFKGVVHVADSSHGEIQQVLMDGTVALARSSDSAGLSDPTGLCFDSDGTLWVASHGNSSIVRISNNDFASPVGSGFSNPLGVAWDGVLGYIIVADTGNNRLQALTRGGLQGDVVSGLSAPTGVAVDTSGTIYIADSGSHRILSLVPGQAATVFAGDGTVGTADGAGTGAEFNKPSALAFDPAGNLWVTDQAANTVRKITPDGVVSTVIGPGGGLDTPTGIAVDRWGEVLIADMNNNQIRMFR